jgi:hypothetical protein
MREERVNITIATAPNTMCSLGRAASQERVGAPAAMVPTVAQ